MQHKPQCDAALQKDGTYDFNPCFTEIAPYVSSADYAVVNLETPLAGKPYSGYPCFCAPDSYAEALKNAGFDMCVTANNHTLDRRDKGLKRTIAVLDSLGLDHVGTYANSDERATKLPFIKTVKGIRIGFLNYTYGTNGIPVQGDVVVDFIDMKKMEQDIKDLRAAGAEIITVLIHWGVEYVMLPNGEQKKIADFLCNQGVDLIIGGHPHVIQPMEIRHNEALDKDCLVVYSLGNFISNQQKRDTKGGAMIEVKLKRDLSGNVSLVGADYSLVFCQQPLNGVRVYKVVPVENCEPAWKTICNAFEKSAITILDKHNVKVNRKSAVVDHSTN
ncbi:MAG: CapA family protein [Muribaculaceae bacterium]|nr:CapA family protein [Muribaculaceae bacterium]